MAFTTKYIKQELDKIKALSESRRLIEIQKKLDKVETDWAEKLYRDITTDISENDNETKRNLQ